MSYLQLIINTNNDKSDLISEILYGLNALSISYASDNDKEIIEPPINTTPLWQNLTITALFHKNAKKIYIKQTLKQLCNVDDVIFKSLIDKVWENEYKKQFKPLSFGNNLWVCPSWEDATKLNGTIINMEPSGLAFGTGSHQTTALCLKYLADNPPINCNIIDYGTGTGILAIAAKKLGANNVIAIDHDPQSILSANNNSKNNNVVIDIIHTDDEHNLAKVDLLISNILANPLITLAQHFANLIKTSGAIALSGILKQQENAVIQAYHKYFTNLKTINKNDWLLITGIRK